MADDDGEIPSLATTGRITLPFGQQDPAQATEQVWLSSNLDASASDSDASLVNAGDSNVLLVSGTTIDGVGGTHTVSITGSQATADTYTSSLNALTGAQTLGALGVSDFSDFSITIDGSRTETISGITSDMTIEDLVGAINQIAGCAGFA